MISNFKSSAFASGVLVGLFVLSSASLATAATTFKCQVVNEMDRSPFGEYIAHAATSATADKSLRFTVENGDVTAEFAEGQAEVSKPQAGFAGVKSECNLPQVAQTGEDGAGVWKTFAYPFYSRNVVYFPKQVVEGAHATGSTISVVEVIDEDNDGFDCKGITWSCQPESSPGNF